jgi:hypothetical protein
MVFMDDISLTPSLQAEALYLDRELQNSYGFTRHLKHMPSFNRLQMYNLQKAKECLAW